MKELVKGKKYELEGASGTLIFSDRKPDWKTVGAGTTLEEVLRACIMRVRFESGQYSKATEEHITEAARLFQGAIGQLQQAMYYEQHKVEMMKQTNTK